MNHKNRYGIVYGLVVAVLAVLSAVGIYQFRRAERLENAVENQYVYAFHELTDYVQDVEVLLKKSMLVSNPRQLSVLASNIYMQTAAAKANLAQLPTAEINLGNTSKFLAQTGDYASYLSAKVIDSGSISEDEYKNMESLASYCGTVNEHLQSLQEEINNQRLSIGGARRITAHAEEETPTFNGSMEEMEHAFQDYPALIYDGPFSEHIEKAEPEMIKDKLRITQDDAAEKAKRFLKEWQGSLTFTDEGGGRIETYNFAGEAEGRQVSISVTKQGGQVYYFLDNRSVTEENLSVDEAIQKAADFLQAHGFSRMESSYYDKQNGTATVNFAAVQDGIILYSDLVKVKVALDNGEILGMEAGGYLMSHKKRELPQTLLTVEEAKQKINSHLSVDTVQLALIPLDSRREVLCYECHGTYQNQNFLIYINAETGQEEKILMLLESDEGILTV